MPARQATLLLGRSHFVFLKIVAGILGVGCAATGIAQPKSAGSGPTFAGPSVRLMQKVVLPGEGSAFTDVRWATDNTVFLSRTFHGVIEVEVANQGRVRRQAVPTSAKLRPSARRPESMARLAVSARYMVLASELGNVTWRSIESGSMVRYTYRPIAIADDIDIWRDRVVLLGLPQTQEADEEGSIVPDGAIAWLGTLTKGLEDFRPILFDAAGKRAPHLLNGGGIGLGSVRFFPDGSFVVVPGFQPGAHLFNAAGMPVKSWSAELTGLTTDTGQLTHEQAARMRATLESIYSWVNQHRSLDDVIALPQGPGLLVRERGRDGIVRWELRVLRPQGVIRYSIPIQSRLPYAKLHSDVRDGKIVFLLHSARFNGTEQVDLDGQLFVADLNEN